MKDNDKKSGLKEFFEKNRSLVYTIPVFVILVIAVILVYVLGGRGGNEDAAENTPAETDTTNITTPAPSEKPDDNLNGVITLPNNERDKDKSEILRNPLASPYKVSGIIYDARDGGMAIIEAENKSYILKAGESAGSYFKVLEIKANEVVLDVDGMEIVLTMSGN